MDLVIGFVMQNSVAQANFVEFRDSRNFTFFEATGVEQHMASHVSQCMAKSYACKTHSKLCVTHGMPCVNMHGTWRRIYIGVWSCSYR